MHPVLPTSFTGKVSPYEQYWFSVGYRKNQLTHKGASSLPLMAVVGLLDGRLTHEERSKGWDLMDHAVMMHRIEHGDLKDFDISNISSLDQKYRHAGNSEPIRK